MQLLPVKRTDLNPFFLDSQLDILEDFTKVLLASDVQKNKIFKPIEKFFRFSGKDWKLPFEMHIIYPDNKPPHLILSKLAIIGKGAERTVHKCYDLATRRFYAEKPIYPTEQKILMQLKGERNPKILGFYNTLNNPLPKNEFIPTPKIGIYVVEELLECSLFSALRQNLFTQVDTRLYLIRDILEGLDELHALESPFENGLKCSHNDLKTENFLIKSIVQEPGFRVLLTDHSYTGIGASITGSFVFQPPEYFDELKRDTGKDSPSSNYLVQFNKKYGCAKDIWAAGLVIIDILKNNVIVDLDDQSLPSLESILNTFPNIENSEDEEEIERARDEMQLDPEAILTELLEIKKSMSKNKLLYEAIDIPISMLAFFPHHRSSIKSCLTKINKIIAKLEENP